MMRLKIAEAASEDVRSILHFYRSPSATADAFSKGLDSELLYLRQWPYTGHRRRDLTKEDVCFWLFAPYLLVLQIRGNLLHVVAVLHSSRHVARILRKRLKQLPRLR
jgi:plasmid stabilization system protein ParE